MRYHISESFGGLQKVVESFVGKSQNVASLLGDATLEVGLSSERGFGIPLTDAIYHPVFVGDSMMIGRQVGITPQLDALYKKNHNAVDVRPMYNPMTGKYDMQFKANPHYTGDGKPVTADAGLIESQLISPWNAGLFPQLYRKPLLYSHARDLVVRKGSTSPWGQVQNLQMEDYSGWAQVDGAGTVAGNSKKNVNVIGGMMSNPVINIKVYYSFMTEELERNKAGGGNPVAGQMMADKQRYAQYVIDMVTDWLTYFGNEETGTPGLFDVNGETAYAGQPISTIDKGSDIYKSLYGIINDFIGSSYNKFDIVRIAMGTKAYNTLSSVPYSDSLNPASTLKILKDNYGAGIQKDGSLPKIEIYADPLLDAGNGFYSDTQDRMVITAPKIGAGPQDDKQDLLLLGVPLENFTYPVVPNAYDQQHCTLRRFSGVFAPIKQAVKVYTGFGVNPDYTKGA